MEEKESGKVDLGIAMGVSLAPRVQIQGIQSELMLALIVLVALCWVTGARILITSILDGVHMRNSLHYVGAAVDFVVSLVGDRKLWVDGLRERLGPNYDVIDEGTHVHVEYQPHEGAFSQEAAI